jgi:hypothetical protein
MKISFEEMRANIEEYSRNIAEYERIQEKLKAKGHCTKVIGNYGLNTGGSGGFSNSKIENKIIERDELFNKLSEYAAKLNAVNIGEKVLNNSEKEVIEFLKLGVTYKLSVIAKITGKSKKNIFDLRNRAIKKMCEYIGGVK